MAGMGLVETQEDEMITVRRDGNEWLAFEDFNTFPESDAGTGFTQEAAVADLLERRPDLKQSAIQDGVMIDLD
jgi:hypothetical protein